MVPNRLGHPVLEYSANLFIGDDPSPLLPPIEPGNFPTNSAGFSIYDGGITSDAESRVTDWIQQQYMKQRNNEIFNKSDEPGFDAKVSSILVSYFTYTGCPTD